jgi:hypothetical protein
VLPPDEVVLPPDEVVLPPDEGSAQSPVTTSQVVPAGQFMHPGPLPHVALCGMQICTSLESVATSSAQVSPV